MIAPVSNATATAASSSGSALATASEQSDRFLKLLVAQINSQDPLNPMDNAQMTTQMAQINTVTGIQQVNQTLKSLMDQFSAVQTIQGASLVGRQIVTQGNSLSVKDGVAQGSFSLSSSV